VTLCSIFQPGTDSDPKLPSKNSGYAFQDVLEKGMMGLMRSEGANESPSRIVQMMFELPEANGTSCFILAMEHKR
jgi:hypothetical protein